MARAMPKSMMRREPSLQIMTFCGLRSRWTTLFVVHVREGVGDARGDLEGIVDGEGFHLVQHLRERAALEQFHDDVGPALAGVGLVELEDVRVIEDAPDFRLALETGEEADVRLVLHVRDLEGDDVILLQCRTPCRWWPCRCG